NSKKQHCGNCGMEGHNKMYCKNQTVPKPPKNKPGRPKKVVTPTHPLFIEPTGVMPITRKKKRFATSTAEAQSQPSMSSAPPRRPRGRPRNSMEHMLFGESSSQP
ncbi:unnamed protein product, partial [Cochlearia groenlandica]